MGHNKRCRAKAGSEASCTLASTRRTGSIAEPIKVTMLIPHFGQGGDWVIVKHLARQLEYIAYSVTINGLPAQSMLSNSGVRNPMPLNEGLKGHCQSKLD